MNKNSEKRTIVGAIEQPYRFSVISRVAPRRIAIPFLSSACRHTVLARDHLHRSCDENLRIRTETLLEKQTLKEDVLGASGFVPNTNLFISGPEARLNHIHCPHAIRRESYASTLL